MIAAAEGIANVVATIRGRGLWSRFSSLRVKHDEAPRAFAGGCGRQARLFESEMQHTSLARGHRPKRIRLSGCADMRNRRFRRAQKIQVAGRLEAICVERDAIMLLGLESQDLGGNMLNGVQKFAVASRQQRGVRSTQLNGKLRGVVLRHNDLIMKIESAGSEEAQEVFDGLNGQNGGSHGIAFIGDE